jgi:two-component system cell cycle sensor histidine kinase/response regulator CckA
MERLALNGTVKSIYNTLVANGITLHRCKHQLVEFNVSLKRNDFGPDILRMTKRHYRELLALLPEGVGITDLNENLVFVNDAFAKILGYEIEELRGMNILNLVSEEGLDKIQEESSKRQAGISSVYETEIKHKDGKKIVVRVSAVPRRDEDSNVIGTIAVLHDITQEKLAEQELRKLSRAVEQSPASVVITDSEGIIEYVNPKFSVLTGYSFKEAVGKNPRILKTNLTPKETHEDLWKTLKDGRSWRGQFVNRKKDGDLYWEEAWISPIFSPEGNVSHFVAVKQDITQRIMADRRAAQSHRDLELYASFLQHDIRNDLQVIMNHAEAALMLMEGASKVKGYIQTVEAASERMVHLLDVFGRPGAAEERDLISILESVKAHAVKTHSNLRVVIKSDLKRAELESARLIALVFDNLIRNSAEFSDGEVEVVIEVSQNNGQIQTIFRDDGPGIPKEILPSLFEKGASTTGGGFGLYLSKKVVEGYGGSIELIQDDRGASFRILLPSS